MRSCVYTKNKKSSSQTLAAITDSKTCDSLCHITKKKKYTYKVHNNVGEKSKDWEKVEGKKSINELTNQMQAGRYAIT